MWLAGYARSIRPLMLALPLSGCAHGIDSAINLSDASNSGAVGASGITGAGGTSVVAGSGGRAPDNDANAVGSSGSTSSGGAGGSGGDFDGGLGGGAGATIADAQSESSSGGAGGMGGNPEAGREATVDAPADASIDAPPEAGCANPTECALKAALVHRYSFNGTGNVVTDSVGTAHGTVVNTQLSGAGNLVLAGGTQYVDLPNGIISQLTNATLEIWLTWAGGAAWQRIFDFGNSTGAENTQAASSTSLYATPIGNPPTQLFAAFKGADQAAAVETRALSPQPLAAGVIVQIAVVIDDTNNQLSLYRNGALDGSMAWADSLSILMDVNNWLGRSQYLGDPNLSGTFYEFRIYNAALSQAAVQTSFAGGTDPPFLN